MLFLFVCLFVLIDGWILVLGLCDVVGRLLRRVSNRSRSKTSGRFRGGCPWHGLMKIVSFVEKAEPDTYNSMDSYNVNTHLPPRKRLLAELRRVNSDLDFLPPVPFVSGDLGNQLRYVVNSPSSTPEEIVEVSKSVALTAAQIAAAARNTAMEKAAAAAKAKASAKSALLFLDSIARNRKVSKVGKTRVRKKQIAVELLYKSKYPAGVQKNDEELARKLHHAINSSPRISRKKQKNLHNVGKEVIYNGEATCNEKSAVMNDSDKMSVKCIMDKTEKNDMVSQKVDIFRWEEEESNYCTEKQQSGSKLGVVAPDRKLRGKKKTMSLSQCDIGDQVDARTSPSSTNHNSFTKGSKMNSAESSMSSYDPKSSSNVSGMPTKISSTWKCKKIKVSQYSSDGKVLHGLC